MTTHRYCKITNLSTSGYQILPIALTQNHFPYPPVQGTLKEYKFVSTLGAGSFGRVMLATTKGKDDKVNYWAVKILNKEMLVKMKQVQMLRNYLLKFTKKQ